MIRTGSVVRNQARTGHRPAHAWFKKQILITWYPGINSVFNVFHILRSLSKKIHDSGSFTLMCNECMDISNKEYLTICLRWVDQNLHDHKNFIGLYQVNGITADTLTDSIKDVLLQLQIDLSMCRGQCYDGASNMSYIKNSVAAQITSTEKWAVYMHCYAYALNLAFRYSNIMHFAFYSHTI